MRIGFVTDEISPDLRDAIGTGLEWGIRDFELRRVGGRRVPEITDDDLRYLETVQRHEEISFTALSPGVFKIPAISPEVQTQLHERLPRCFELALHLHAPLVIVFGFQKSAAASASERQQAIEYLARAARLAEDAGVALAVENEPGFWCDSGSNTAEILEAVNSPWLRANWDPANAVGCGEPPYPDGYERLRPHIANLHIKDTPTHALDRCVLVGDGVVDWPGQLAAIQRDGILELVTIETHCEPLKACSRENLQRVQRILAGEDPFI